MRSLTALLATVLLTTCPFCLLADELPANQTEGIGGVTLQALARSFFEWRRVQQPAQGDDIPRVERPDGWLPDFSPDALEGYREDYRLFFESIDGIDTAGWSVQDQVDARLLRAAIQRVHWELDVLKAPHRNPLFYVDQTLGSVFELLILSSPMTESRAENILLRLEHIPKTSVPPRKNLDQPVRPFAQATIETLADIEAALQADGNRADPGVSRRLARQVTQSCFPGNLVAANYSKWLDSRLDTMQTAFALGPNAYQWFLINVALIPYTPDELLAQGAQAWNRSVAWDVLEQNRNSDLPQLSLFKNAEQQVQASLLKENEIRAFLESQDLMTVPDWLMHYRIRPMPDYLAPLSFMGVNDDLTSETRLDEDAYSYIREPSTDLPYFRSRLPATRAPDHSRGRSRTLLSTGAVLGNPEPDPAALHRFQHQRRHRLLRRRAAAAGRPVRLQPALPGDHLQLCPLTGAARRN